MIELVARGFFLSFIFFPLDLFVEMEEGRDGKKGGEEGRKKGKEGLEVI